MVLAVAAVSPGGTLKRTETPAYPLHKARKEQNGRLATPEVFRRGCLPSKVVGLDPEFNPRASLN